MIMILIWLIAGYYSYPIIGALNAVIKNALRKYNNQKEEKLNNSFQEKMKEVEKKNKSIKHPRL